MIIILLLVLIFTSTSAQQNINVDIMRGDAYSVKYQISGNIASRKIAFVVKNSFDINAPRIIEKKNLHAGGSDNEIVATYDGQKTNIIIKLYPEDTESLSIIRRYYDITSASRTRTDDVVTIIKGLFIIIPDIGTPYDGADLPAGATRILTAKANDFNVNDYIYVDTVKNNKIFKGRQGGGGDGNITVTTGVATLSSDSVMVNITNIPGYSLHQAIGTWDADSSGIGQIITKIRMNYVVYKSNHINDRGTINYIIYYKRN